MAEQLSFQTTDGGSIPTSPLQLFAREVNRATANVFYRRWHYLGDTPFIAAIHYGAYYNGLCQGVISFGSPNAKKLKGYYDEYTQGGWWEIKRLAMRDACPKNSESRFIAVSLRLLRKTFTVKGIVTLADSAQKHTGVIYKASGFKYLGLTAYKTDYQLENGKLLQRGKPTKYRGNWIPRARKHLYIKVFGDR